FIGDIDGDGLVDIAIADPTTANAVYIYKGRSSWPATLTDSQADYVIKTDASYAGSQFGLSMARLGDFTGDSIDDLAIGVRAYNGGVGRVVIIPGKAGGLPSTISLPDATNSIVVDGDSTLGKSQFGYRVLGLGHFYTGTATTLIASAPGTATSDTTGQVYAFHGQAGSSGTIAITSADNVLTGPAAGARLGESLTNLSSISGANAVGIGNSLDAFDAPGSNGAGYVMSSAGTSNPFASKQVISMTPGASVGVILIGGGLSGLDARYSLIGDGTPDVVLGAATTSTVLAISDGATLGSRPNPDPVNVNAEVTVSLPSGATLSENSGRVAADINGDGVADFCVGNTSQPGSVVVYW
ncbi:MAG TPA: integrin alpha, partial [Polyangia bacterium]|nr:integrin alpha [Polyangia bacterium]